MLRIPARFGRVVSSLSLALAVVSAGSASAVARAGWLGIYVWGGVLDRSQGIERFYDTVKAVLDAGFDTIRITPGPSAIDGVRIAGCEAKNDNLGCYADRLLDSPVWDDKRLKRLLLTAFDRACQTAERSNNGCLDAASLRSRRDAIMEETVNFLELVAKRFSGRDVEIILSDWEGDNFVYCGNAYDFSRKQAIVVDCRSRWPSGQTNAERVQAHLLWIGFRDEAVQMVKRRHPELLISYAPEFNNYRLFEKTCDGACDPAQDTVLSQMRRAGGRDLCSYSSYDSAAQDRDVFVKSVRDILTVCKRLIIGEAGLDLKKNSPDRLTILFSKLDEVRRIPGVMGVVLWNAVNPVSGSQRFGLFESSGRPQVLNYLGPLLNSSAPGQ